MNAWQGGLVLAGIALGMLVAASTVLVVLGVPSDVAATASACGLLAGMAVGAHVLTVPRGRR